jgi:hypothetical protein
LSEAIPWLDKAALPDFAREVVRRIAGQPGFKLVPRPGGGRTHIRLAHRLAAVFVGDRRSASRGKA